MSDLSDHIATAREVIAEDRALAAHLRHSEQRFLRLELPRVATCDRRKAERLDRRAAAIEALIAHAEASHDH